MKRAFRCALFLFGFFMLPVCHLKSSDPSGSQPFAHIVSWGPWNGRLETNAEPKVLLDGKSISAHSEAYSLLDALHVESGDRFRIEIPTVTELHDPRHDSVYCRARFLCDWLKKGAKLSFFQGSHEYEVHTLTWSNYRREDGTWKDDLRTAHIVLDNEDIGLVDVALDKLKQMHWDKGVILQIYRPYPSGGSLPVTLDNPEDLYFTVYEIAKKHGLVEEEISPLE